MTKPTTEKLGEALKAAGAPPEMISKAYDGYYDDYKSPLDFPETQLLLDAKQHNLPTIIEGVYNGEWDGTKEESSAWAQSPEGQAVFQEFLGGGNRAKRRKKKKG